MIKIRNGLFETNSSSTDVYDDYDDGVSDDFYAEVSITFTFTPTDEVIEKYEDLRDITEDEKFVNAFLQVYNDYMKQYERDTCFAKFDTDDLFETDDPDNIILEFGGELEFLTSHYWEGSYYPATRYSPEEYPSLYFEVESPEPIWIEEWTTGLEAELLKSYCGQFIKKIASVTVDDDDFCKKFNDLENQ